MGHQFDPLSGQILESAVDVHRELGPGFLESVYERAMRVALRERQIEFEFQKKIPVYYRGIRLGFHKPDLIVADSVVVELKAIKALEDIHFAQVRSYLKATKLGVGLLLNFNAPKLAIKRIVLQERQG